MTEQNDTQTLRRDSELGSLMPNLMASHQRRSSVMTNGNEALEIRQYMNAAYNIPGSAAGGNGQARRQSILNIGPLVTPSGKVVSKRLSLAMNKAMNEKLTPSGKVMTSRKHPNAKKFCIRVRNPMAGGHEKKAEAAVKDGQLDPEELKDALLQQALEQRRALVNKSLRQGTGRGVKKAKFELSVVVRTPVQPSPEPNGQLDFGVGQTSTQQAGVDGDLSPFNFAGRPTKALSPMEGVPERLEFVTTEGVLTEKKRGSDQLMPPPPPVITGDGSAGNVAGASDPAPNADFDFGYDDYGGDYYEDAVPWLDEQEGDRPLSFNNPLPGRESENPDQLIAPKRRRVVINKGIRLRGELRRKSLANDENVGLQEVAPGLRRSTRRAQEPLKWWLNEKKVMSRRKYKAMPTVAAVITDPDPASPWKTVEDPVGARQDKFKVKGPPKKKGPKKGVKQVMETKEATARTPQQVRPVAETAIQAEKDLQAERDLQAEFEDANVEVFNDDEMTEDEDTLMINGNAAATENQSAMSDVTVPLGQEGKANNGTKRASKATPTSRKSKSRKSTKSMCTIPEADVPSPIAIESIDILGDDDDEIIIGGRASTANVAQSETIGDELTLNVQAEPSTATTVDQNQSVCEGGSAYKDEDVDENATAEGSPGKENEEHAKTKHASVNSSPSKEPMRRSTRNRRTASSAGGEA